MVLSVLDRQEPTAQDFEAKKDQIRDALIQNKQQEMFGLFVTNLRAQMEKSGKIQINRGRDEEPDPRPGRRGTGRVKRATAHRFHELLVASG